MEDNEVKTPDELSDVSVSASNSRPSTAAEPTETTNTAKEKEGVTKSAPEKEEKTKPEVVLDPYYKAMEYLEEHNIIQFFQKLTAAIVYERPADPVEFIVDKAEEVAESLNNEQLKKFYKKPQ